MKLSEIILQSADQAVRCQNTDGSFKPGSNGPHQDQETPVRNTSNWLVTLIYAYKTTGDSRYFNASINALDYLKSGEVRTDSDIFKLRKNEPITGGLNAQAWVLDALIEASIHLDDKEALVIATRCFNSHSFNPKLGLWRIVNSSGKDLKIDATYNHQVSFAAMGRRIAAETTDRGIESKIDGFISNIEYYAWAYEDGLIRTPIKPAIQTILESIILRESELFETQISQYIREQLHQIGLYELNSQKEIRQKAYGYQGYHLYVLSLLAKQASDKSLLSSEFTENILNPIRSTTFIKDVMKPESEYGSLYNPVGFEIALGLETFGKQEDRELARKWVTKQIETHWDSNEMMLSSNTPYPRILSARIHEATRLPNYELELEL